MLGLKRWECGFDSGVYHMKFVSSSTLGSTLDATQGNYFSTKCDSVAMCFLAGIETGTVLSAAIHGSSCMALVSSRGLAKLRKGCVETWWNVD